MSLSLILQINNKPGIVIRVALLLERRGYSINSLAIEPIDEGFAEMSLQVTGNPEKKEQIIKQLCKIIDVIQVEEGADASAIAEYQEQLSMA